jgi:hypothetical protein
MTASARRSSREPPASIDVRVSNSGSSRMGKSAELLVAATCIVMSRASLNVSTSLVDDEGVDLVFHRRNAAATLAVQVKARFDDAKVLQRGQFHANVRSQTMTPRSDLYLLFVVVSVELGAFDMCWLVPSVTFVKKARRDSKKRYVFVASTKPGSRDQWRPYRLTRKDLFGGILDILGTV